MDEVDPWSATPPAKPAPTRAPASAPSQASPGTPRHGAGAHSEAYDRFIASMVMDYDKWHDGTGYDLAALQELASAERDDIARILAAHAPRDWRDIEALGHIDTPAAKAAVVAALTSAEPAVRREAQKYAGAEVESTQRERLLIQALETTGIYGGLSQALDEAAEFHPPGVVEALFRGARRRDGEAAVHFAALLYYIYGKASEPFDWKHRPFFLRFGQSERGQREAAFAELCRNLAVDPGKYA